MSTETNKPVKTLRDGNIKAIIWRNESDKGPFYNVQFLRSYKAGDGDWREANSFSNGEILKVAKLADKAYDATLHLKADDKANAKGSAQ